MMLSAEKVRKFRALGWSVRLPLARRPTAVAVDDVLPIGEDVMIDERTDDLHLVDLDGGRLWTSDDDSSDAASDG